ncbi:catechol 2,3-dioxygenase [Mesorhizobium temperatum]|uniref:Metapyrocatechase n=1 Tax=Mesorhizobium temperatum TaxID=241416 RepID=A0A271L9A4_9HYPH|nr:catechol 2,3-dioxygenase [Mesorhizobium temperatum]PAQ04689.1 catechol 2,3-dioxygenase [Mesorhizobium temperatum]
MNTLSEPIFDVAQLAHVELLTPDLDGTLRFFMDLMGMQETERRGKSVYLRGYEEQYHHSLKVTEAQHAGLGHVAWRTRSPQALERRVAAVEATGLGRGWIDGDAGHGRAFRFETPGGHSMELLWDVDYVSVPPGQATKLLNRPQRRPLNGIPVRRIDHLNLMAANTGACRDFMVDVLGFRERERVVGDNGSAIASWLSVTNLSHDIAIVPEPTEMRGRFHHVCFHYISVQHLFDLAELAREAGISIEHGPGRHGIGGATFLYMLEPGGNRIEVMGDPGYMIFDPAWKTVVWEASKIADAVVWSGSPVPDSFWVYGTPVPRPVEGTTIAAVA